jgi:hypothetical protein
MIKLLYVLILVLLFLLLILNNRKEKFIGYGTVFGVHTNPNPNCKLCNDCHPGYYYRSQQYQNMCEPIDTRLTREPVNLVDNCVKSLDGNMILDNCNNFY